MANPPIIQRAREILDLFDREQVEMREHGIADGLGELRTVLRDVLACVAALQQERDEAKKVLDALIPDVRIMVQDHFSGLPEHRAPVFDAATRLDHLVFDDDANPRDPLSPVPGQPATEEAE